MFLDIEAPCCFKIQNEFNKNIQFLPFLLKGQKICQIKVKCQLLKSDSVSVSDKYRGCHWTLTLLWSLAFGQ